MRPFDAPAGTVWMYPRCCDVFVTLDERDEASLCRSIFLLDTASPDAFGRRVFSLFVGSSWNVDSVRIA